MTCQFSECNENITVEYNGVSYCLKHVAEIMKITPSKRVFENIIYTGNKFVDDAPVCENCSA